MSVSVGSQVAGPAETAASSCRTRSASCGGDGKLVGAGGRGIDAWRQ